LFLLDGDIDHEGHEYPVAVSVVLVRAQQRPQTLTEKYVQLVGPAFWSSTRQQLGALMHEDRKVWRDQLFELAFECSAAFGVQIYSLNQKSNNLPDCPDGVRTHDLLSLPHGIRMRAERLKHG